MECEYGCGQDATYQLKNKKWCCSKSSNSCSEIKRKNRDAVKQTYLNGRVVHNNFSPPWHKGLTKETDERLLIRSQRFKESIKLGKVKTTKGLKMSIEFCEARSIQIKKRYEDGWLPKSGRCKKIQYNSIFAGDVLLDGTWELGVAKWLDENNYNWSRNKKRFSYINLKGNESFYTPDFYIEEWKSYLEVKGYETDLDRCKWKQFSEPLIIWKKDELIKNKILS